ncbi:MAG: hypothetical protein K2N38_03665 [Oscillospiraceae bacterium]|nr:hypothetical protein [Oscillospiraceae bacterium]
MRWEYFIMPALLIITGIIMLLVPTSTVFAYKTRTASKNEQTQEYCNVLSARIMIAIGVVSAIALVLTRNAEKGIFGFAHMDDSVMCIMLAVFVFSLPIVNICCRKKFPELFDEDKK